jgi:hypothetical protein
MISRKLDKEEWKPLLDFLSKQLLEGKRAEIEVASLDLGDQVEAQWLPLVGIVYDHKDDIIEVALEDIDHHIDHIIYGPREIYLIEDASLFISLDIIDADGRHQIVRVKDPLMLPSSQAQKSASVSR